MTLYCEECRKKFAWPVSEKTTKGHCEFCFNKVACHDKFVFSLPETPTRPLRPFKTYEYVRMKVKDEFERNTGSDNHE